MSASRPGSPITTGINKGLYLYSSIGKDMSTSVYREPASDQITSHWLNHDDVDTGRCIVASAHWELPITGGHLQVGNCSGVTLQGAYSRLDTVYDMYVNCA